MTRELRYLLLDVFTDVPLAGNQLAVFPDAHGLDGDRMQALARETNLSETTFCFPDRESNGDGVRVRIFTTQEELPFAGHPTLGTATALRMTLPELEGVAEVRLRLQAGTVPVRFANAPEKPVQGVGLPFGVPVAGEMEQPLPRWGQLHENRAAIAAALGLPSDALDRDKPVQTVSTGLPFAIVPLVSVAALGGMRLGQHEAEACLRGTDARFFYAIAPDDAADDSSPGTQWRARMQFYGGEDPATGSAAGCATAYLVGNGYAPAETSLTLRQGVEIDRPATIRTRARLVRTDGAGSWTAGSYVSVGGSTILVAEGRFFLP